MKIAIITPFPEMVASVTATSILRRAAAKGIVSYSIVDLRRFGEGAHRQIDDYPYGGGTGMVMMAEPILRALDESRSLLELSAARVVYPTPQGGRLSQEVSRRLSQAEGLVFICGHYKGIDERVRTAAVTDEISIGDYVLSGGELPAMVILESVVRLIPDVLGDADSAETDSFSHRLLDHPHYTRPETVRGVGVPEVLLSGHHGRVEAWRMSERELRTRTRRPDLWKAYEDFSTKEDVHGAGK